MEKPLVSVIVIVYNVERYIHRGIDSLLAQTYRNLEVILVDDCSPDNCGAICDEYAAKDSRVKVIHHQVNGGLGAARQTGIDNVTGDYMIHVDPDDWIEPTMIEELVDTAQAEGADMVICDYQEEYPARSVYSSQPFKASNFTEVAKQLVTEVIFPACWNKLVSSSITRLINFNLNGLRFNEDMTYCLKIFSKNPKVAYIPKAFYHYNRCNANSMTANKSDALLHEKIKTLGLLFDWCEKNVPNPEEIIFLLKRTIFHHAVYSNKWSSMKKLYPEIHSTLIKQGTPYNIKRPAGSCISIALWGGAFPYIAALLFRLNMSLIDFVRGLKRRMKQ